MANVQQNGKYLFWFHNIEIARYSDDSEDRYVWAKDEEDARRIFNEIMAEEEIEWDVDEFACYKVWTDNENLKEHDSNYYRCMKYRKNNSERYKKYQRDYYLKVVKPKRQQREKGRRA